MARSTSAYPLALSGTPPARGLPTGQYEAASPSGGSLLRIAPGNVRTPMNENLRALPGYEEQVSSETPARRFGEPEEIAAAVVFFASDAASFVHGASLLVDGGWIAR